MKSNNSQKLEELQAQSKARWRDKLLRVEQEKINEERVKPENWTCKKCGAVLSNRIRKCPCLKEVKKPQNWTCKKCGAVLSNRIRKCPCLKVKKPENWTCKKCGAVLSNRIRKCPCLKVKTPKKQQKQAIKPEVNWEALRAFLKRR